MKMLIPAYLINKAFSRKDRENFSLDTSGVGSLFSMFAAFGVALQIVNVLILIYAFVLAGRCVGNGKSKLHYLYACCCNIFYILYVKMSGSCKN